MEHGKTKRTHVERRGNGKRENSDDTCRKKNISLWIWMEYRKK